ITRPMGIFYKTAKKLEIKPYVKDKLLKEDVQKNTFHELQNENNGKNTIKTISDQKKHKNE
ncbi:hypothetical protein COBT_002987, partial [Conglomerata obtusa]